MTTTVNALAAEADEAVTALGQTIPPPGVLTAWAGSRFGRDALLSRGLAYLAALERLAVTDLEDGRPTSRYVRCHDLATLYLAAAQAAATTKEHP